MRVLRRWTKFIVKRIREETHDCKTFVLADEGGGRPFDFFPGQALTFRFDEIGEQPLIRSFSLSSAPCHKNDATITVKRVANGLVSNWLMDDLVEGTEVKARGPMGKLYFDPEADKKNLYMVAGGSGVTPFLSVLSEYAPSLGLPGYPNSMTLLVVQRTRQDRIGLKVMEGLRRSASLKIVTTLTKDAEAGSEFWQGRPNKEMLQKLLSHDASTVTMLTCGPVPMMELVRDFCLEKGMTTEQFKMESFGD